MSSTEFHSPAVHHSDPAADGSANIGTLDAPHGSRLFQVVVFSQLKHWLCSTATCNSLGLSLLDVAMRTAVYVNTSMTMWPFPNVYTGPLLSQRFRWR